MAKKKRVNFTLRVKYKVTNAFGLSPLGEIREAYLIFSEGDCGVSSLLYHPRDPESGTCASLELCGVDEDGYYVSSSEDGYINIGSQRELNRVVNNLGKLSYRYSKAKVSEGGKL